MTERRPAAAASTPCGRGSPPSPPSPCCVVLVVAAVAIVAAQRRLLTEELEETLVAAAGSTPPPSAPDPGAVLASPTDDDGVAQIVDAGGTVLAATANLDGRPPIAGPAAGGDGRRRADLDGVPVDDAPYLVVSRRADGDRVVHVGATLGDVTESTRAPRRLVRRRRADRDRRPRRCSCGGSSGGRCARSSRSGPRSTRSAATDLAPSRSRAAGRRRDQPGSPAR